MVKNINIILVVLFLIFIFSNNKVYAESENDELQAILEVIQKDIKTLEKAVYSETKNSLSNNSFDQNSEDVLTNRKSISISNK